MDGLNIKQILDLLGTFGMPGLVLILWWISDRSHQRTLAQYREDMVSIRGMYESNVELVRQYQAIASSLQDVVILNTQAITTLCNDVRGNQYCPMIRLQKQSIGLQEDR